MTSSIQIPSFVSTKRGVLFFLLFYGLASLIFFFVYHPLGMFNETGSIPIPIDAKIYLIQLLMVGYVILIASRILLYNALKVRPHWTFGNVMLWVSIEFLLIDFLVSLLGDLLGENDMVMFYQMLMRVTLDLLGLYMVPMFIVALMSVTVDVLVHNKHINQLNNDLQLQAETLNSELETVRAERAAYYQQSLELKNRLDNSQTRIPATEVAAPVAEDSAPKPILSDMLRIKNRAGDFDFALPRENVLYVETVDNYICINYLDCGRVATRIVRNTMKQLEAQLQQEGFVRCHRQYLVNKHNIKSVSKEKDGIIIHLNGCDRVVPVGKTFASQLL